MRIKVSDIPDEGLLVEYEAGPGEIDDPEEGVSVLRPARAEFSLKRVGEAVFLEGSVEAGLGLVCARCGKGFPFDVKTAVKLHLDPIETLSGEDERELGADELDVGYYTGGALDLGALLREQVLLQAPMKPVCAEGCLGLCQYCGQDKNEAACSCEGPAGHPGFAGLKELLEDKGKRKGAK